MESSKGISLSAALYPRLIPISISACPVLWTHPAPHAEDPCLLRLGSRDEAASRPLGLLTIKFGSLVQVGTEYLLIESVIGDDDLKALGVYTCCAYDAADTWIHGITHGITKMLLAWCIC